jgi:formamidopyrimidine-DNA glycosylase
MPELPEVETIVRELKKSVIKKRFSFVEVFNNASVFFDPSINSSTLNGKEIVNVERRGKFICIKFAGITIVVHLRMTGRLTWSVVSGREKYVRAVLHFDDGTALYFSDVRKFGKIWIYNEVDYQKATGIHKLGIEPLSKNFSYDYFANLLKHKKGRIKAFLLKQEEIAGIGNIYADEICFRSGLHPDTEIQKLSSSNIKALHGSIIFCLKQGIKHSGVSVSDFVGTRGDLGKHQKYLKIYGRFGERCYVCKAPVRRIISAGRGTSFCEKCQLVI